jgi:hypothetical protein
VRYNKCCARLGTDFGLLLNVISLGACCFPVTLTRDEKSGRRYLRVDVAFTHLPNGVLYDVAHIFFISCIHFILKCGAEEGWRR